MAIGHRIAEVVPPARCFKARPTCSSPLAGEPYVGRALKDPAANSPTASKERKN
jgi:hypothetical protein